MQVEGEQKPQKKILEQDFFPVVSKKEISHQNGLEKLQYM